MNNPDQIHESTMVVLQIVVNLYTAEIGKILLFGSLIDDQPNPLFIILISDKRPEFVTLDHETSTCRETS